MSAEPGAMTVAGAVRADTPRTAAVVGPVGLGAALDRLLLIVGERLLSDPDTYWHIEAGRWVWAHAAVPATDPFSHKLPGAPWLAPEWLSELILAGAHATLGWARR